MGWDGRKGGMKREAHGKVEDYVRRTANMEILGTQGRTKKDKAIREAYCRRWKTSCTALPTTVLQPTPPCTVTEAAAFLEKEKLN